MIILNDLSKKFDHSFVVESVNLKISEGEIIGILGPNGAGKTTTLRMIVGVIPPSRGNVVIDGENMRLSFQQLKKKIGYLPENNPLYEEMTVEEYLMFWCRVKGIRNNQIQDTINYAVEHTAIEEVYYKPISQLSKGFKQRVGLSQALLGSPPILIFDEPTEGLDPNQRREIKDLISSLGKKRTVIISSHVLSEISKIATRIVILHKGKIVADGSVDDLGRKFDGQNTLTVEIKGNNIMPQLHKIKGITKIEEKNKRFYIVLYGNKYDPREEIFHTAVKNKWIILAMSKKEIELEDVFRELTSK